MSRDKVPYSSKCEMRMEKSGPNQRGGGEKIGMSDLIPNRLGKQVDGRSDVTGGWVE